MTPLFGPGWGNYVIRGIVETEVPEAVSLVPQTPGWYVLGAGLALGLIYVCVRGVQRFRRNRYRRVANARLLKLRHRFLDGDLSALSELAPRIRSVALVAGDRRELASLRGEEWQQALQDMAPKLPPIPVVALEKLAYGPPRSLTTEQYAHLFSALRQWIKKHRYSHA